MREVLLGSPAVAFAFGVQTRHSSRAVSGHPSTGRASGSGGTLPSISNASPTTATDRSHGVPMASPTTLLADITPIRRFVVAVAFGAFLTGVGRIDPFHADASALGLILDECAELPKRPGGDHAIVFATFACRALTDACQLLQTNHPHALLHSMLDDGVR